MSPADTPVSPDLAATLGYLPPQYPRPPVSLVHRLTTPDTPETVRLRDAAAAAEALHERCEVANKARTAKGIALGLSIAIPVWAALLWSARGGLALVWSYVA